MSRRDLSQPSFVDAMVGGYGKVGGSSRGSTGRRSMRCFVIKRGTLVDATLIASAVRRP